MGADGRGEVEEKMSVAEEEKREMGMAFGQANPERWVKALEEMVPTEEEISINPRARSARLRGAERLQEEKK